MEAYFGRVRPMWTWPMSAVPIRPQTEAVAGAPKNAPTMIERLQGVPRAALAAIFGKELGGLVWERARNAKLLPAGAKADGASRNIDDGAPGRAMVRDITDFEVAAGLIAYLSEQAGKALCDGRRQAKTIVLKLYYADGLSATTQSTLPDATNRPAEIFAIAIELFRGSKRPSGALDSIELTVSNSAFETAGNTNCLDDSSGEAVTAA